LWLIDYSGKWLVEPRLLKKRIDVRIKGTVTDCYHGGRYEDQIGTIEMFFAPTGISSAVEVVVGANKTRRKFKLQYLEPVRTNESGPLPADKPISIEHCPGQRVIVIGPDLHGQTIFIGFYGKITQSQHHLLPGHACVYIKEHNCFTYFDIASLCRSSLDAINY
jgi:hypothetical protein